MQFNFDEMAALAKTDPTEFERRRSIMINEQISAAPVERQAKLKQFQRELDDMRKIMSSSDYLKYLASRMQNNIEAIGAMFEGIKNTIDGDEKLKSIEPLTVFMNSEFKSNKE